MDSGGCSSVSVSGAGCILKIEICRNVAVFVFVFVFAIGKITIMSLSMPRFHFETAAYAAYTASRLEWWLASRLPSTDLIDSPSLYLPFTLCVPWRSPAERPTLRTLSNL